MEGWFRKQNRGSFFKRVEEFYGVLVDNVLVLQRNEDENSVVKEVHLQGQLSHCQTRVRRARRSDFVAGARVRYNNDPKYGDTVELTYTAHGNENKTYHVRTYERCLMQHEVYFIGENLRADAWDVRLSTVVLSSSCTSSHAPKLTNGWMRFRQQ